MPNELLLVISLIIIYSSVIVFYRLFGNVGIYCWTVFATVAANIEVTVVISAFGMQQTLGNILFASTFLATDILSETTGKKSANKAVLLSVITSALFIVISQLWLLFTPDSSDISHGAIATVFKNTPRIMFASIFVYAIVQFFDVFAYHFIWEKTTKLFGDSSKLLWLRNNLATILSQLINTVLYTLIAFWGIYPPEVIFNLIISTFIIYIFTSLLDTPAIYLARSLYRKGKIKE